MPSRRAVLIGVFLVISGLLSLHRYVSQPAPVVSAPIAHVAPSPRHTRAVPTQSFEVQAQAATGALFTENNTFICSGTEIGHDGPDGVFLTARHCVADYDTNKIAPPSWLSFTGNEKGPYYAVTPIALSLTDDLALLRVINGAKIPTVAIADEHLLKSGDPIFGSSFPLGMGKLVFHGEFVRPNFEIIDPRAKQEGWGDQWDYSMPMNLTIAPGSSGSGVFSPKYRALVGVSVGVFNTGEFAIAIPASRVYNLLTHVSDNTVEKFAKAHPVKAVCEQIGPFVVCPGEPPQQ